MSGWLLIVVGCAECRFDEPLVSIEGTYPTSAAARNAATALSWIRRPLRWQPHPLGGEYDADSQGDIWVAPVVAFTSPKIDAPT